MKTLLLSALSAIALTIAHATADEAAKKNVVIVAGTASTSKANDFEGGGKIMAECLKQGAAELVDVQLFSNREWPDDATLAKADTLVIYAAGGDRHPAISKGRLAKVGEQMKRGCGLMCVHFALEVPMDNGPAEFREWLGGYFEKGSSAHPQWKARFTSLPKHPITRGVKPYALRDEWYFRIRFIDDMKGVNPILTSRLNPEMLTSTEGQPELDIPEVRDAVLKKKSEVLAWTFERKDGGRGFGFTGGHLNRNWQEPDQRKLLLNAVLWTAKAEVPPNGVTDYLNNPIASDPEERRGKDSMTKKKPEPVAERVPNPE